MAYHSKYLLYKTKYLNLKNQLGGTKIALTKENTKIVQERFINNHTITDPSILNLLNNAYNADIKEFIPHSDKDGEAIMWKIYYNDNLVGFGVSTDLAQFEKYPNFQEKGGIRDAKGLYITSIAGDSKYSGVVGLLFGSIDNYANDNNYDYLLLEAKKYEPNYLVGLYNKYGFKSIKELTDDGETGTLMCKNIQAGFNCFDKINTQIGGGNKIIIHVSGPSGSGKTYLGNKLKDKFGSKIVVKDIDNLRSDFINKTYGNKFSWNNFDSKKYQKFIDNFINKQTKPLILVGLNHMFWHNKDLYYNLHSNYNFYIKIDDMLVVKQKCIRFITDELQDIIKNDKVINDITKNNKNFVKLVSENIERECGTQETLKINKMWNKDYKSQGYKFMSREDIYKEIVGILKKQFHSQ
jgi:hypothetical protein